MQNGATRFKIWSSKHNVWIYVCVLLLLGIYGISRIRTKSPISRLDAILLFDKNVQAKIGTSKANNELLINTTGCKLDLIRPFDDRFPETREYFSKEAPTQCLTEKPSLSYMKNGILHIDTDVLKQHYPDVSQCIYKTFQRDMADSNWVLFGEEKKLDLNQGSRINDDFVAVYCKTKTGELVYRYAHKQIVRKTQLNGGSIPKRGQDEMNVVVLAIESASRSNWLRQCPDVHDYVTNTLGGITFKGMNKLADNTVPNLYAMTTGKDVTADWKHLMFSNVDDLGWIWKDAEKEGYVSFLAEQVTKNKRPIWTKDFKYSAADHYHRPMRVYMAKEHAVPKGEEEDKEFCYGSKSQLGSMLDWYLEFSDTYRDLKTFAIMNFDQYIGSHADLSAFSSKEHVFMEFFKKLENSRILNDTLVVLVGDHGFRVGDYFATNAGEYEAKLPLLTVIPPKLLKDKYPEAYTNLVQNAENRVVSPLDVWRTAKSILHQQIHPKFAASNSGPGSSLFWPISEERTCEGAGIPQHWCACGSYETLSVDDRRAQKVGQLLIQSMNKITTVENDLCIKYDKFIIKEARIKHPAGDILVVLQTTPVKANYRASVGMGSTNPVITNIERLDRYAGVVKCLANTTNRDQLLPKTCICKDAV